jgi:hypothetical protein
VGRATGISTEHHDQDKEHSDVGPGAGERGQHATREGRDCQHDEGLRGQARIAMSMVVQPEVPDHQHRRRRQHDAERGLYETGGRARWPEELAALAPDDQADDEATDPSNRGHYSQPRIETTAVEHDRHRRHRHTNCLYAEAERPGHRSRHVERLGEHRKGDRPSTLR